MIKKLFCVCICITFFLGTYAPSCFANKDTYVTSKQKQQALTPQKAMQLLKQGDKRFVNHDLRDYNFKTIIRDTAKQGQHPFAMVLSCMDSRSVPDILFDQGLGNIFVARVAGNIANVDMFGSMEFAASVGVKLFVIMGHSQCGAVAGACLKAGKGNLRKLLSAIQPAVNTIKAKDSKFSCQNQETLNRIAKQNVMNQMQKVKSHSLPLKKLLKQHKIMLLGAMHNIKTGDIVYFDIMGKPIKK